MRKWKCYAILQDTSYSKDPSVAMATEDMVWMNLVTGVFLWVYPESNSKSSLNGCSTLFLLSGYRH